MDISWKLNKNFVAAINRLEKKYGKEFLKINNFDNNSLNYSGFIDHFVDKNSLTDISANPSSNTVSKDIVNLESNITQPHLKLLCYNKLFYEIVKKYGITIGNKWLEEDWNGALYMHDAPTCTLKPYCYAADIKEVAERGLFFIDKFKTDKAPQHLITFSDHILQTIGWLSNRQSGAVGLPSFFVYSYYFWLKDIRENYYLKNPEYYREQHFQKIIYDLNQPYLRVAQSAFTNFSIMDESYLIELFGGREFPNGESIMDHIDGIIEHQKVYMKVSSNIRKRLGYVFPVLTYSLLFQDGHFVNEDFARFCSDHNTQWKDGNFYTGADVTSLSNCCRLISDTSKLDAFINSIGGTSLSIGSVKVNTINLRRIALEANGDKDLYISILKERAELCMIALDRVRHIIKRNIEKGLLPNYDFKLLEMDKQYNTIGCTAMYETLKEFNFIEEDEFGNQYYSQDGLLFAEKIMNTINESKEEFAKNKKYSINIEFVPGESCNIRLAKKDSLLYPQNTNYYIYGNQWIPLDKKCTINEKIRLASILDKQCGGGQISHINIDGDFANKEQAWNLLNAIARKGVIYFAFNSVINECKNRHFWIGNANCPQCGEPIIEQYTRIVGFLTPVSSWSKERKQEFESRNWFNSREIGV